MLDKLGKPELNQDDLSDVYEAQQNFILQIKELRSKIKEAGGFLDEMEAGFEENPLTTGLLMNILGYSGDFSDMITQVENEIVGYNQEIESIESTLKEIELTLEKNSSIKRDIKDRINKRIERQQELIAEKDDLIAQRDTEIEQAKIEAVSEAEFNRLSSAQKNSRAARDNMKLDIYWEVLTNKDTFSKISNPGNFDELMALAKDMKIIKGVEDDSKKLVASPSVHINTFADFMAGKQLIAIFASQNAAHAVLQHSNLELAEPIEIDGELISSLHDIRDLADGFVTRNFAQLLAAVVDNAKDPVSNSLNINMFTADTLSLLLHLGLPLKTAIYIINQPAVIRLTEEFLNTSGKRQDYRDVRDKLLNNLKISAGNSFNDGAQITTESLIDNLHAGKNTDLSLQYAVIMLFDYMKDISYDLGKVTSVTRTDNSRRAINLNTNYLIQNDRKKSLESKKLVNVESVYDNFKLLDTFYDYTVTYANPHLNELFPWNSRLFKHFKDMILDNMADNKNLTTEQLTYINFEILGYLSTNFHLFDGHNIEGIINDTAEVLEAFKEKYPELLDNALIKRLEIDYVEKKKKKFPVLRFRNTGSLNESDVQDIFDAWKALLDEPKFEKLGLRLIKSSFYTNGFHFGPNSFAHFIPPSFYSTKINDKQSLSDFLYEIQDEIYRNLPEAINKEDNSFYDQFYRNAWGNTNYVPSVDNSKVRVNNGMFQIEHKFFPQLLTKGGVNSKESIVSDYITVDKKGTKTLYKKILTDGKKSTYKQTEPLGLKGIYKELGTYVGDGMFEFNKVKKAETTKATPTVPPAAPNAGKTTASNTRHNPPH